MGSPEPLPTLGERDDLSLFLVLSSQPFLNVFGKSLLLDTLMATFIPATKTFPESPS